MIVRDEETLEQALSLIDQSGEVRYSDEYNYIVLSSRGTLGRYLCAALGRESIAVVVPSGEESSMENFYTELARVKEARRVDAKRNMQQWFQSNSEFRDAFNKASKEKGFNVGKFVSRWKRAHGGKI
jgi:hypothetical protein